MIVKTGWLHWIRSRRESILIGGLLSGMMLYFLAEMYYRVANFLTFYPADSAEVIQALWNIWEGRFFQQTILDESYNLLSFHGCYSMILFSPLIKITGSGISICLAKNAMVVASAIPMYFIIRHYFVRAKERVLLFLAYCTSAFLIGFNSCEIHFQLFALPAFVASYYFYLRNQLRFFLVSALFCILTKENFCFVYLIWGLLAFLERKGRWWIMSPIIVSMAFLMAHHFLNTYFFIPSSDTKLNLYEKYYGVWGDSLGSCLYGMLSKPGLFFQYLFKPDKWLYLLYVAFPFFPFLFLRPKLFILSLSNIGIVFLMSGRNEEIYHPGLSVYYLEICVFSFIAFIEAFFVLKNSSVSGKRTVFCLMGLLIFLVSCIPLKSEFSSYLLKSTGLNDGFGFFIFSNIIGILLIAVLHLSLSKRRKLWFAAIVFTVVLSIGFYWTTFSRNILCAEVFIFENRKILKFSHARNSMAKIVLENVPIERSLAIPIKYAILGAARPEVCFYNGTEPISKLKTYSNTKPEFVFLDLINYHTFFDLARLEQTWDRSHIQALIKDTNNWEIVFYYQGLYLLQRHQQKT